MYHSISLKEHCTTPKLIIRWITIEIWILRWYRDFHGSALLKCRKTKYFPHTCKVCKKPTRKIRRGLTRVGKFPHAIHVQLSEDELELGSEIRYKMLVRSYQICHIEQLRDVVEINRLRYEKYKRKKKKITNNLFLQNSKI